MLNKKKKHISIWITSYSWYPSTKPSILSVIAPLRKLCFFFCCKGVAIVADRSKGIVQSNMSLVLQRVSRRSSGAYTCTASNRLGAATSNELQLTVKCEYKKISKRYWLHRTFLYVKMLYGQGSSIFAILLHGTSEFHRLFLTKILSIFNEWAWKYI